MIKLISNNDFVIHTDSKGIEWKYKKVNIGETLASLYRKTTNESSIKRVTSHMKNGAIIISAYRGTNDIKTNKRLTDQLASDIRSAGFGYVRVLGGYVEADGTEKGREVTEESFFIPLPKGYDKQDFFDFAIDMCRKYNQDSVLISIPGFVDFGYYNQNGEFDFTPGSVMSFDEKDVQQYFSKLVKGTEPSRKKWSFTEPRIANESMWFAVRTPMSHTQAVKMDVYRENILYKK